MTTYSTDEACQIAYPDNIMCMAPVRFEYNWTPQDYDYSQFVEPEFDFDFDHDMDNAIDIDDVFDFLENEFDPIQVIE